jgi:hypothetical protein
MKTIMLTLLAGLAVFNSFAQSWKLNGNSGTNPDTNFLGTTNRQDLVLRTGNIERLRITKNGRVAIGIINPQQKLDVNGNINLAEGSGLYIGNERMLHTSGGPGNGYFPNIFVGQFAGNNSGGSDNTAVGYYALHSVRGEAGLANVAMGFYALKSNTQGNGNSALGYSALYANTNGVDNTACGSNALFSNITGNGNTANGFGALEGNSLGSYNTAVGTRADINEGSITNSTIIGNNALAMASNQVRIGNSSVTSIGGYTDWTNISDGRVKKNIRENVPGLSFINKLKPITYNLDLDAADKIVQRPAIKNKDANIIQPAQEDLAARQAKEQIVYTGLIAQDVEKAAKELNYDFSGVDAAKNDKDLYGLRYAEFVVPLVKAVQELSKQNDDLKKDYEQKINDLQQQVNELQAAIVTSQSSVNKQSSTAYINQNIPNPFNGTTTIGYYVPVNTASAIVNITDANGKLVKSVRLDSKGDGKLILKMEQFSSGAYFYSLVVNDRLIDTKKMIAAK